MVLEICAANILSAIHAQQSGAQRIELCSELAVGGITPSYGLLKEVTELLDIEIMVLIRPRSGNFVYTDTEFEIMKRNIEICKEIGCHGVVSGILNPDFTVDIESTQALVEIAKPMQFTFHRAFDHCSNPNEAIQQLASIGVTRILTSGQAPKALAGIENLKNFKIIAGDSLTILPGGGINAENARTFKEAGFTEIHASATQIIVQSNEKKVPINSPQFMDENIEVISNTQNIQNILKAIS